MTAVSSGVSVPQRVSEFEALSGANQVTQGSAERAAKSSNVLKIALGILFAGAVAFGAATAKGLITGALAVQAGPIALAVGIVGLAALSINAIASAVKNCRPKEAQITVEEELVEEGKSSDGESAPSGSDSEIPDVPPPEGHPPAFKTLKAQDPETPAPEAVSDSAAEPEEKASN